MNNEQIKKYLLKYFESDITKRAIMLNAAWGCGKTHFIKEEFLPLFAKTNKNYKFVYVSLFGIESLYDLSKTIYLGLITKGKNNSNGYKYSTYAAKTVIKGVASFFNIDLTQNEDDLKNIYNSVNLKNTLLILDDYERCGIEHEELLGFVNDIMENNNGKVIIICNEGEITSDNYKKIKEKTICETINFYPDKIKTVKSILRMFKSEKLTSFSNDENKIFKILETLQSSGNINFRTLIFVCQKTKYIYESINFEANDDFIFNIFMSILQYKINKKTDSWPTQETIASIQLSSREFPLYKIIYKFLQTQEISTSDLEKMNDQFIEYNESQNYNTRITKCLNVIKSCYIETEKEIINQINNLITFLKNGKISSKEYLILANYLIYIKYEIEIVEPADLCLNQIKECIKNLAGQCKFDDIYPHSGIQLNNKDAAAEYEEIEKLARTLLNFTNDTLNAFNYDPLQIEKLINGIKENRSKFIEEKCFLKLFDIEKLVNLVSNLNSQDLLKLKHQINYTYRGGDLENYYLDDMESLKLFRDKLTQLSKESERDKVQKHQIKWFINDLNEFIGILEHISKVS